MGKIQFRNPWLTVFESALYRTTSTVVQTDDLVLLVDPNWLPEEVMQIRNYVEEVRAKRPLYILLTHSDYDHILGVGAFDHQGIIASKAFAERQDRVKELAKLRAFDARFYVQRSYPIYYPEPTHIIDVDGATLNIGSTHLQFALAAGHTACGLFTLIRDVWIAGDYLSDVEMPFIDQDYRLYLETLRKSERLLLYWKPDMLIPGHGSIAFGENAILKRLQASRTYLEVLPDLSGREEIIPGFPHIRYEEELWMQHRHNVGMTHRIGSQSSLG